MEFGIGRMTRDVSVAQPDRAGEVAGDDDEAALIAAAQADPLAFGALYRRYLPRVYRYVRAHAAGDDDAADLAQQVFLRALDALPAYRPRGAPFAAWLFRMARNATVDAARSRRPTVDWQALPEALHPADEHGPETELLRREDLQPSTGCCARSIQPSASCWRCASRPG